MKKYSAAVACVLLLANAKALASRTIYVTAPPSTYYWVELLNPSTVNLDVDVEVKAQGIEEVGVGGSGGNSNFELNWGLGPVTPSSQATECPTNKLCRNKAAFKTIAANGGVFKMGFGTKINPSYCYYGCRNNVHTSTDSVSGIGISITVLSDSGFLVGHITTEGHYNTQQNVIPLVGGHPF